MQILAVSHVHTAALDELARDHTVQRCFNPSQEELTRIVAPAEVLIFRSGLQVDAEVIGNAPRLRLLVRAGAGTDNIDMDAVARRGLTVRTIPEPGAKAVAEMAFALMLALARNLGEADRSLREGRWRKHELTGRSLGGKTLGVLGAGNIGSRVGRLGAAWDMEVLGTVEYPAPAIAAGLERSGIRLVNREELLARSDYVSVHVPLKDSTRHLLDAAALARMKPGAFLVNLARGGVVDEDALHDALVEGRLGGAALDVHAREGDGHVSRLASLPNVILTPHIGAGTVETQQEIGARILEIVADFEAAEFEREALPVVQA